MHILLLFIFILVSLFLGRYIYSDFVLYKSESYLAPKPVLKRVTPPPPAPAPPKMVMPPPQLKKPVALVIATQAALIAQTLNDSQIQEQNARGLNPPKINLTYDLKQFPMPINTQVPVSSIFELANQAYKIDVDFSSTAARFNVAGCTDSRGCLDLCAKNPSYSLSTKQDMYCQEPKNRGYKLFSRNNKTGHAMINRTDTEDMSAINNDVKPSRSAPIQSFQLYMETFSNASANANVNIGVTMTAFQPTQKGESYSVSEWDSRFKLFIDPITNKTAVKSGVEYPSMKFDANPVTMNAYDLQICQWNNVTRAYVCVTVPWLTEGWHITSLMYVGQNVDTQPKIMLKTR